MWFNEWFGRWFEDYFGALVEPDPDLPPSPEYILTLTDEEMKRSEIRIFLRTGVNDIVPVLEFGSGQITDFNAARNHRYPSIWQRLAPVTSVHGTSSPLDSWEIILTIAQKDAMDSNPEAYEDIIDTCDEIAQKLIYKYRNVVSGYKKMILSDFKRNPFVKKYADCLSGVDLSFVLRTPDQTNVC